MTLITTQDGVRSWQFTVHFCFKTEYLTYISLNMWNLQCKVLHRILKSCVEGFRRILRKERHGHVCRAMTILSQVRGFKINTNDSHGRKGYCPLPLGFKQLKHFLKPSDVILPGVLILLLKATGSLPKTALKNQQTCKFPLNCLTSTFEDVFKRNC